MIELTYRVVQEGKFVGYVLAASYVHAQLLAWEQFGRNCLVNKLLV